MNILSNYLWIITVSGSGVARTCYASGQISRVFVPLRPNIKNVAHPQRGTKSVLPITKKGVGKHDSRGGLSLHTPSVATPLTLGYFLVEIITRVSVSFQNKHDLSMLPHGKMKKPKQNGICANYPKSGFKRR